ncbi:LysR family transcriptional regulator [Bordetella genomosp. 5]|uniref:LysR family transcriptional regulator n=1 Tax=Bordetella genomosp. 5 TaxID=1395608 RepID=A0A261TR04_9BORD|nr:LysR family transcriptional regulator [Bordetella genomosp. 5]OZI52066.1 LysR family transcriptional regulator [Bordetella genomosp. 5]
MLNTQWLQTFRTVAETGGFTRAAERLDLTQAAVSQHIRHLESELGPLLIRRTRRIELTPAGQALLQYCSELEQADRRLHGRLADADACRGEVSLITPGSIGLALYPLLLDFQQSRPGIVVRHRFAPDPEALEGVLDKQYELGLVTLKPDDPRIVAQRFIDEPLELVAPAGRCPKSWDDLLALGFIDHPDGQAMATRLLARRFPGNPGMHGMPVNGYSNQVALLLEPVARGLGFTVIPRHARQCYAHQDALDVSDCGKPVADTLWWIHRAEWPMSVRARHVIEYLQERMLAPEALVRAA